MYELAVRMIHRCLEIAIPFPPIRSYRNPLITETGRKTIFGELFDAPTSLGYQDENDIIQAVYSSGIAHPDIACKVLQIESHAITAKQLLEYPGRAYSGLDIYRDIVTGKMLDLSSSYGVILDETITESCIDKVLDTYPCIGRSEYIVAVSSIQESLRSFYNRE